MITKQEFIERCNSLISDEEKKKYSKALKRRIILTILIPLIELAILFLIIKEFKVQYAFYGALVIVISLIIIFVATRYSWEDFKEQYASESLKFLFEGYKYDYKIDKYLGQRIFNQSGFGSTDYDYYSGEDLLTVNIPNDDNSPSNTKLSICDLRVTRTETYTEQYTDKDGNIRYETKERTIVIYKGVFGYISFPFEFKCNLGLNNRPVSCKKIKLEDTLFNKAFNVYTDNQLEALIILTPTLMNKLIKYKNRVSGFKVYLNQKGYMYFGMKNNLLSLNTKGKPSGKAFERFYDDVTDILLLVEEIKTNNRVFKM